MVQLMAWCLQAPSHYLNLCWLFISEVLWHSSKRNFTEDDQDSYLSYEFEGWYSRLLMHIPGPMNLTFHDYQEEIYPRHNEVVGGYIGFTPSVHPSVHPSVLHPVSALRNLRRCVACKVFCKICNFFEFVTLTLSCFDLGSDINH